MPRLPLEPASTEAPPPPDPAEGPLVVGSWISLTSAIAENVRLRSDGSRLSRRSRLLPCCYAGRDRGALIPVGPSGWRRSRCSSRRSAVASSLAVVVARDRDAAEPLPGVAAARAAMVALAPRDRDAAPLLTVIAARTTAVGLTSLALRVGPPRSRSCWSGCSFAAIALAEAPLAVVAAPGWSWSRSCRRSPRRRSRLVPRRLVLPPPRFGLAAASRYSRHCLFPDCGTAAIKHCLGFE